MEGNEVHVCIKEPGGKVCDTTTLLTLLIMPQVYTRQFDTPLYKGTATVNTGLFINNEYVDAVDGSPIE